MQVPHVVFELRPSKTTTDAPTRFAAVLSALPQLHNRWFDSWLKRQETLSFELIWQKGRLGLICCAPYRLHQLVSQVIMGWFPEMVVTALSTDPVSELAQNQLPSAGGWMSPTRVLTVPCAEILESVQFPSDPLIGLFSTLTALPASTQVAIQVVCSPSTGMKKKQSSGSHYHIRSANPLVSRYRPPATDNTEARRLVA